MKSIVTVCKCCTHMMYLLATLRCIKWANDPSYDRLLLFPSLRSLQDYEGLTSAAKPARRPRIGAVPSNSHRLMKHSCDNSI